MPCVPGEFELEADSGERYFMYLWGRLMIFGHTVDAWRQARFPEDEAMVKAMRERGYEFGCWHSVACLSGEMGTALKSALHELTFEQFKIAAEAEWAPDVLWLDSSSMN